MSIGCVILVIVILNICELRHIVLNDGGWLLAAVPWFVCIGHDTIVVIIVVNR